VSSALDLRLHAKEKGGRPSSKIKHCAGLSRIFDFIKNQWRNRQFVDVVEKISYIMQY
jgi:hypothetical protein